MGKKRTIFNPLLEEGFQQIDEGVENIGDFLSAIGIIAQGLEITPNANLTFDISGGALYQYNSATDSIDTFIFSGGTPAVFDIIDVQGNIIVPVTSNIDFTRINAGGSPILTTLPANNDASYIEIFMNMSGDIKIIFGQVFYATLGLATRLYFSEVKILPPLLDDYIRIGGFLGRKDTVSLQTNSAFFVP